MKTIPTTSSKFAWSVNELTMAFRHLSLSMDIYNGCHLILTTKSLKPQHVFSYKQTHTHSVRKQYGRRLETGRALVTSNKPHTVILCSHDAKKGQDAALKLKDEMKQGSEVVPPSAGHHG
jgi:hypothetical protein